MRNWCYVRIPGFAARYSNETKFTQELSNPTAIVPVIGEFSNNCWISNAHGSLGTSSAPLAGSIIASKVIGWIPPINRNVEGIVDPYRFKERQGRRGQLKSKKFFIN